MKALIISGRMVQDQELVYPYYRLQEAGYQVTLAARSLEFHGIQGVKFSADTFLTDFSSASGAFDNYNMLVIPGGVKCMEHLRLDAAAVSLVQQFHAERKIIAAICSGAQMLITAKVIKGRKISAYPAMSVDVENAGAEFVDSPAVVDGHFVTSPHYKHLGAWMSAALIVAAYPQGFAHA